MFDTNLLQAFTAVASERSFTRAAEVLCLTQSAISAQVKRLEEQAGCELFVRSTRAVALTEEGQMLLSYSRTILQLHTDARARLQGSSLSGKVRIGASEDFANSGLAHALRQFHARNPKIVMEVEIGIGVTLFDELDRGKLDVVLASRCKNDTRGWPLWQEPLVWAFAAHEKLDRTKPIPLALFPDPCPYRLAAIDALGKTNREWRIGVVSSSLAGIKTAAVAGLAVATLTRGSLGPDLREVGKEEGLPELPEVQYVLYSHQGQQAALVRELTEVISGTALRA